MRTPRGITSSREIERCCRENITFMALSGNSQPHFTTIADFISTMEEQITPLFLEVLLVCDDMQLIGREMFAIDGCKMPANVSREWSGTKEEMTKKIQKMERAIRCMLARHKHADSTNKIYGNQKNKSSAPRPCARRSARSNASSTTMTTSQAAAVAAPERATSSTTTAPR